MIEPPRIVDVAEQATAVIALVVPREEIRQVMGPGIGEVMAAVAAQGLSPTGPWFTYHRRVPGETFDLEVGVPVAAAVRPTERVRPGRLPAARVARTVYHGDYEGLAAAWGELEQWIEQSGHGAATELWECYAVGPETSPDPARWRTELHRPLLR